MAHLINNERVHSLCWVDFRAGLVDYTGELSVRAPPSAQASSCELFGRIEFWGTFNDENLFPSVLLAGAYMSTMSMELGTASCLDALSDESFRGGC